VRRRKTPQIARNHRRARARTVLVQMCEPDLMGDASVGPTPGGTPPSVRALAGVRIG
jgi:hypothetical protein